MYPDKDKLDNAEAWLRSYLGDDGFVLIAAHREATGGLNWSMRSAGIELGEQEAILADYKQAVDDGSPRLVEKPPAPFNPESMN